jgi:hypothetical protein
MELDANQAKAIAHGIAFGHAYWKHVADADEYGELLTQSAFEEIILETLLKPAKAKALRGKRSAFWNAKEAFLVIHNPNDPDLGTAYWPAEGRNEFENLH